MIHASRSRMFISVLTLALVLAGTAGVFAGQTPAGTRTFLLSDGFVAPGVQLCDAAHPDPRGPVCPATSSASNGDVMVLTGVGSLSTKPKSVTGGGTFSHLDADGNVLASGTWTANQLVSFTSYGTAVEEGVTLEGGHAIIQITLSTPGHPSVSGQLQIFCLDGGNPPPSVTGDGFNLSLSGGPNFNRSLTGVAEFLPQ